MKNWFLDKLFPNMYDIMWCVPHVSRPWIRHEYCQTKERLWKTRKIKKQLSKEQATQIARLAGQNQKTEDRLTIQPETFPDLGHVDGARVGAALIHPCAGWAGAASGSGIGDLKPKSGPNASLFAVGRSSTAPQLWELPLRHEDVGHDDEFGPTRGWPPWAPGNEALDPINCKTLSKVKSITPNTGLMGDRNEELPVANWTCQVWSG
jgi:hypothetical protein